MDDTLTDRQLRFVFEYLLDQNASAAAARAGYSEKSRAAQGRELMNNPAVQERIRLELQSLLAELGCSSLQLIKERKRAAFFRSSNMFTAGWELAAPDQMDEDTRAALEVRTVTRKNGPVIHLRQPDRNKALRALERVHERLDALDEKHWAKLEKEGRLPSLEEMEAMEDREAGTTATPAEAPADFSGKCPERNPLGGPMGLWGGTTNVVEPARDFSEKPMGLSGSTTSVVEPALVFRENSMGLSGAGVPQPPAWETLHAA